MSGGTNACPICQAMEIQGLKQQLAEAQAACAEKHAALSEVWDRCCEIGGQGLDALDADKLLKALSNKAGQDFLAERDRLRKALELVISAATCEHCGKPATCVGRYEDESGPIQFACDECCGHGNEDGWCKRLPTLKGQP